MYFDAKSVDALRDTYNREHPREPPIQGGRDAEHTWIEIRGRLRDKCKTGTSECVLTSLLSRPKAPSEWKLNPEEWLSTDDIETMEHRFEKLFPTYAFIGTFPIDFGLKSETGKCLISTLCSADIRTLAKKKGKTQFGIVFNTDVSSGPGEHWVAVFCDVRPELEHPRMTYFDSYAQSPEPEIKTLMRQWKRDWDASLQHTKPMELTYNKTRHQYKDSECGMYCLYFHYCCLTGVAMEERVPDDVMNSLRNMLFKA